MEIEKTFGIGRISNPQGKFQSGGVSFTRNKTVKAEARSNGEIEELLHG